MAAGSFPPVFRCLCSAVAAKWSKAQTKEKTKSRMIPKIVRASISSEVNSRFSEVELEIVGPLEWVGYVVGTGVGLSVVVVVSA